jgi:ABC-type antimicrobial peptide transport system permease subunit
MDTPSQAAMYVPFVHYAGTYFYVAAKTSQAGLSMLPAFTSTIHQINPEIATKGGASMSDLLAASSSAYMHRSSAWLVGGFATLAFVLGVIGLYGVVAYSVSKRTREIGIRMALGARPNTVYQLILKEAGSLTAVGISIGLVCAVGAAQLMRGLLFGVTPWDVPTLTAIGALLGAAALLASFIPARKAASVNPIETLRSE